MSDSTSRTSMCAFIRNTASDHASRTGRLSLRLARAEAQHFESRCWPSGGVAPDRTLRAMDGAEELHGRIHACPVRGHPGRWTARSEADVPSARDVSHATPFPTAWVD